MWVKRGTNQLDIVIKTPKTQRYTETENEVIRKTLPANNNDKITDVTLLMLDKKNKA